MSALLYTLGAFALILVLARVKVPLAIAIIAGAVGLGIAFGLGPRDIIRAAGLGVVQPMSIGLLTVTMLLLIISESMRQTGQLQDLVSLAGAFFRRPAITMAALPALIGLLPMPGGALFSAPMVQMASDGKPITAGHLSAINYWYRHIWEHWWPLYPGVILAMTLTAANPLTFAAYQIPVGLMMLLTGIPILYSVHPSLHQTAPPAPKGTAAKLAWAVSPIWVLLAVWLAAAGALQLLAPRLNPAWRDFLEKFGPISVGLLACLLWTCRRGRVGFSHVARIAVNKTMGTLLALVISVMIFQYVLKMVDAAPKIRDELAAVHAPILVMVIVLPFIAGMITGLAFGFVGVSFPLVLALIQGLGHPWAYIMLAYASGHLGMMISPLHLCYVVSNKYFNTPFTPVYRHLLLSVILMAVCVAGYFILLRIAF